MKYLFETASLRQLKKFCDSSALFAFDFDGTLAPICAKPDDAAMRPETLSLLTELEKIRKVAVISGRGLKDVLPRLPSHFRRVAGNHGLEQIDDEISLAPMRVMSRAWLTQLSTSVSQVPGLRVEDKDFSLTIHFRHAKKGMNVQKQIRNWCLALDPVPRLIPGKHVLNVIPMEAANKGGALSYLLKKAKLKRAFYIGDERSDEDAFRLKGPEIFSVRVRNKQTSSAKYYIKSQKQIERMLETILDFSR